MYRAPTEDMQFLIDDVLDVGQRSGAAPSLRRSGVGD